MFICVSKGDPGVRAAEVLQQANQAAPGEGARSRGCRLSAEAAPHPLCHKIHQDVRHPVTPLFTHIRILHILDTMSHLRLDHDARFTND